jgi:hypothetical protein
MLQKAFTYLIALALLIPMGKAYGQFNGGNADGCTGQGSGLVIMFSPQDFCSGGTYDGFSLGASSLEILNDQVVYCSGSISDGFSPGTSSLELLNEQVFYCSGGVKDGVSATTHSGYFGEQVVYCSGGISDGLSTSTVSGSMFDRLFTLGGNQDGFILGSSGFTTLNTQEYYCQAGIRDGAGSGSYLGNLMRWSFCFGGVGDGQYTHTSGLLLMGYGIWTGAVSSLWETAENWKHNTLPTSLSYVTIPAGAPYYPELQGALTINHYYGLYRCKRLDITSGGQLTITGNLIVRGIFTVAGTLDFISASAEKFTIQPGGSVKVKNGGEIILE